MKLSKYIVDKPWGRTDIPPAFGDMNGRQVGEIWFERSDDVEQPLLVKWLFTSDKLSVQVHPSQDEAVARGEASGKEECWYVVDAEPGAVLGIGTIRPLNGDELRDAALDGSIEEVLDWKPVKAGDYFYIPSGTVHAIGAGITLVEVQQYADITYRLYDYGRPRELHLDDAVAVSRAAPYADARSGHARAGEQLVDGPHFRLWLVKGKDQISTLPADIDRWITPLSGHALVGKDSGGVGDCLFAKAGAAIQYGDDAEFLVAAL